MREFLTGISRGFLCFPESREKYVKKLGKWKGKYALTERRGEEDVNAAEYSEIHLN